MMAQQAMNSSTLKHEDTHNLDFYFDKVRHICLILMTETTSNYDFEL